MFEENAGARQVLVVGAGVIGSVYAGRLAEAGHLVTLVARGGRLAQLEPSGLRLRCAGGSEIRPRVTVVDQIPRAASDLVLVAVRREQVAAAAKQVAGSVPRLVMLFGNFAGMVNELGSVLGDDRTLVGFPGIGGRIEPDGLVTYMPIDQQPTVVGTNRPPGEQAKAIVACLRKAGFDTLEQPNIAGWLASHAALVVPMAVAIRAAGGQADALADRSDLLHLAVRATSATYRAQRRRGELVVNRNLRLLYLVMPDWFATRYWSGALRGEFGELAFAAHTRHAWDEMALLATWLRSTIADDAAAVVALDRLLAYRLGP
jgi:2-dehydropantoate 2-reductase